MVKYSLIFLILIGTTLGEDIYVAQTAQGADNGTNAANAKSLAWLNTAANWGVGAAKVSPGDTVHLVGTFTSPLIPQASGTAGNYITILFESGAGFTSPCWPSNGAIQLNNLSWLIIDGGTNGYIKNTDSGAPPRTFHQNTRGIGGSGVGGTAWINDSIIRNLRVTEIYYKVAGQNNNDRWGYGIDVHGGSNITIENNLVADGDSCIGFTGYDHPSQNIIIQNNTLLRGNHLMTLGSGDVATTSKVTIRGNYLDDWFEWDTAGDSAIHLDGIYFFNAVFGPNSRFDNVRIYNNWLGRHTGVRNTGAIMSIFQDAAIQHANWYVFNNVIESWAVFNYGNPTPTGWGNGDFGLGGQNIWIFNNTVWHDEGSQGKTTISSGNNGIARFYNNISNTQLGLSFYGATATTNSGANTGANTEFILANYLANMYSDYNVYKAGIGDLSFSCNLLNIPFTFAWWLSGGVYPLSGWQTWYNNNRGMTVPIWNTTHADPHSVQATPTFVSGTYVPSSTDTVARGKGLNLSAVYTEMNAIWGDAQTPKDYYGNPRPATGNWTIGAFEQPSGAAPTSPTLQSATINSAGTTVALVFSEAVQAGAGGSAGWTMSATGGAVTVGSLASGSGTTTLTYNLTGRLIGNGETATISYTQPGNGLEDLTGNDDLATLAGFSVTNSSTVSQATTPSFSPIPGAYSSTQNVTMTSAGAVVRYTTNGTDPTASSTQYTAPIPTSISTTYKARAFRSGFLDSAIATGTYQIGDFVLTNNWTNIAVPTQTGTFTWSFRGRASAVTADAVMALADHSAVGYPDLAVIPRFGPAGRIDAFNGATGAYSFVSLFTYQQNQDYDFVVTVNIPDHTYSMTVVLAGGSTPTTIASNYPFRSTQSGVVDLDVFAGFASIGTVTVSNMVFTPVSAPGLSVTARSINTAGTQLTMTFNSQPAFGVGGQGGFTVSASGGTTIATSPTIGSNAITWTLSRPIGRGESVSATYVQPGNGIEAATGGADLASFAGQSVLNNSTVDLTAPTPNPSTFGIAPTALTSSTITMTATTSSDTFTPPVSYFFNEVSGNAGGSDSGWQSSATFTDAGLAAGTQYRYRVQTRDSAVPPNVTTFSQEFSATTKSVAGARPAQPFNMARANIVTP